ncbi:MAG: TonB-dependent receptor [Gemmatimonadetes bacterium]|nr:TonB-dependent receptor [Gemmatimonadota bacterium]
MRMGRWAALAAVLIGVGTSSSSAQEGTKRADSTTKVAKLAPITVTATRSATPVFRTSVPVLVVDSAAVREESPNGVGDLFRNLPGVDVTGVGPNQGRLVIRGQRGQRILLAEDGIRLNNARRQQDFGELPSLTDINDLSRVEVVRGPASVLYGTDAIGGVVNQITLEPPARGRDGVFGSFLYRHSSADGQNLGHARISGRSGRFGFGFSGGIREADEYSAPAGTFGDLTLARAQLVRDVGVRDRNFAAKLSYDVGDNSRLSLRVSRYEARDAGFGYVDPLAIGDSSGVIVRLLYPEQNVTRVTAAYQAQGLSLGIADRLSVTAYGAANDRFFDQAIDIPFSPTAGMTIRSRNFTDIATYGARVEAAKILAGRHTLTYGLDWYLDRSDNTDSSTTRVTGFGPPSVRTTTTPTVPNASYWTGGVFAQSQFQVTDRFVLGAGLRGQTIQADTRATAGLPATRAGVSASNGTAVGHVSAQYAVSPKLNLVATVGRAFRAPNLIERYFEGAAAEGNGFQIANPDLTPETSLNVDVGFKLRTDRVYAEFTYFSNTIRDGIRIVSTGTQVNNLPGFQNRNIAKLRDHGVEALAEVALGAGFAAIGHFSKITSRNVDQNIPAGDSYSSKVGGELAWRELKGRFGLAYEVRHQGERKDIELVASPVGDRLPAFTVHTVRGEVKLPTVGGTRPVVNLAIANLTNELYAEASNTSFFRPEPKRSAVVGVRLDF